MEFERAAVYRDQLRAVEAVREEQRVVAVKDVDQDVVGFYREGSLVEVLVLLARGGHVKDTLSFSLRGVELPDEEVLAGFLAQYYGEDAQAASLIPDEILLPAAARRRRGRRRVARRAARQEGGAPRPAARPARRAPRDGERERGPRLPREAAQHRRPRGAPRRAARPAAPPRPAAADRVLRHLPPRRRRHGGLDRGAPRRRARQEALPELPREGRRRRATTTPRCTRCSRAASAAARRPPRSRPRTPGEPRTPRRPRGDGRTPRRRGGRRQAAARGTCRTCSSSTAGAGSSAWRSRRRATSGCTTCPSSASPRSARPSPARRWSTASTCPGRRTASPSGSTSAALFFLARARDEAHRFANHARKKLGKARRLRSEIDDIPGLGAETRRVAAPGAGIHGGRARGQRRAHPRGDGRHAAPPRARCARSSRRRPPPDPRPPSLVPTAPCHDGSSGRLGDGSRALGVDGRGPASLG